MTVTEEQFAALVNETKGIVLSAIRMNLFERHAHAIDDVVQEVYLRAFKGLTRGKFREESKLSTWLHVIAKNESLRMNSKLGREETKKEGLFFFLKFNREQESEENDGFDPGFVKEKVGLLPGLYKDVVMLHYEGRSEDEIGQRLSLAQGTVKSRLHRGKKMMKKLITSGERSNHE